MIADAISDCTFINQLRKIDLQNVLNVVLKIALGNRDSISARYTMLWRCTGGAPNHNHSNNIDSTYVNINCSMHRAVSVVSCVSNGLANATLYALGALQTHRIKVKVCPGRTCDENIHCDDVDIYPNFKHDDDINLQIMADATIGSTLISQFREFDLLHALNDVLQMALGNQNGTSARYDKTHWWSHGSACASYAMWTLWVRCG